MKKKTIQRNEIADAFFECVSEFCRNSGAQGFDSKAEYVSGKREKGLSKMICTADYGDFIMEFTYNALACAPGCAPSVFNITVIAEPQRPEYRYSLYDMMYLLAPDNFKCYRFSFIESPGRMVACFDSVKSDLEDFIPKIRLISKDYSATTSLREKLTDAIKIYYGYNVYEQLEDENSGAEYALQRYYDGYQLRFDSTYYAAFTRGDYAKALKLYGKAKNKSLYEIRLLSFIETLVANKTQYIAVCDGCDSLNEGLETSNAANEFTQFLLGALIFYIPMTALCIGIYYLIAYICFHGAIWSDSYLFSCALVSFVVSLLPSFLCSSRLFVAGKYLIPGKKRRKKFAAFQKLGKPKTGCLTVVSGIAVVFSLIYLFLFASSANAYYDGYFKYGGVIENRSIPYTDVACVIHSEGEYDIYGEWVDYEAYYIVLDNRDSYNISGLSGVEITEEKILPVLTSKGIQIIEVRDAGEYTDAGNKY